MDLHILKALQSGHTDINTVTVDQLKKAICWAAEGGHVDVMKYFHRGFEDIKQGSIHKLRGQFLLLLPPRLRTILLNMDYVISNMNTWLLPFSSPFHVHMVYE